MPRHSIELAQKHYEDLPQILKEALFSTNIAEQMHEIGKKFGLTIEKTGIIAEETGYIMLGLARPDEFVANLSGGLGVDTDKAQEIAAEINHQIFFPLREELKRTHSFDMGASSPRLSFGEAGEILGSAGVRVSGMHPDAYQSGIGVKMPPSVKKTFAEEKSPLVADLTRISQLVVSGAEPQTSKTAEVKPAPASQPDVQISAVLPKAELEKTPTEPVVSNKPPLPIPKPQVDQVPKTPPAADLPPRQPTDKVPPHAQPRFEPFASPSGRITDLQNMTEIPPPPIAARATETPAVSRTEPWEKDLEKEVSSLLTQKPPLVVPPPASLIQTKTQPEMPSPRPKEPLPIDLRPQRLATAPVAVQSKTPPIDLREQKIDAASLSKSADTGMATSRMTPQLQDLSKNPPDQSLEKNLSQPGIEAGPTLLEEKMRATEQQKPNTPKIPQPASSVTDPQPAVAGPSGDPYREPIEETEV